MKPAGTQSNCTELLDPLTMGICPDKILLTIRVLSNEETRDIKKEVDEIDKKIDEAREVKSNNN